MFPDNLICREQLILKQSTLFPKVSNPSDVYALRSHNNLFGALKHPSVLKSSDDLSEFRLSLPILTKPPNIMDSLLESISFINKNESRTGGVDSGYESPGSQEEEEDPWISISKLDFTEIARPFNSWERMYEGDESVSMNFITFEPVEVFDKVYRRYAALLNFIE
jgi:hypothetical protein